MLWDLEEARLTQRFFGRPPGTFVVRSCFGGMNANFVLSGSEGTVSLICTVYPQVARAKILFSASVQMDVSMCGTAKPAPSLIFYLAMNQVE